MVRLAFSACLVTAVILTASASAQLSIAPGIVSDRLPCPIPVEPFPSGVTDRPNEVYESEADYYWCHSSTHLQGNPRTEKFAASLFYFPTSSSDLGGLHSAIVVNNPSPTVSVTGAIEYYDEGGTLLAVSPFTLGPDETHTEMAVPLASAVPVGRGSARIVSTNGNPFVGETIHHASDLGRFPDNDLHGTGITSSQQLQSVQNNKKKLWWGPIPATNTSGVDALNGLLPFFVLCNPTATPINVGVGIASASGQVLPSVPLVIPPYSSSLQTQLYTALRAQYLGATGLFDDDWLVVVNADGPVIGDAFLADAFGDDADLNLEIGTRLRLTSMMMPNTRRLRLTNPELVHQDSTTTSLASISTLMGLLNAGNRNVGPVRIEYRDRDGVLLGTDTIGSMPRGTMARIGPGQPLTPNYPIGGVFSGHVRIRGCRSGLVGWSMRATEPDIFENPAPFKAWGETLHGTNGAEPGNGFQVTDSGSTWKRKVICLTRVWDSGLWFPGYSTFLNRSVPNVGPYFYRFFRLVDNPPFAPIDVTNYGIQPYAGVRYRETSFTFEDSPTPLAVVSGAETISGRVDVTNLNANIMGIKVKGDPILEWGLGFGGSP